MVYLKLTQCYMSILSQLKKENTFENFVKLKNFRNISQKLIQELGNFNSFIMIKDTESAV